MPVASCLLCHALRSIALLVSTTHKHLHAWMGTHCNGHSNTPALSAGEPCTPLRAQHTITCMRGWTQGQPAHTKCSVHTTHQPSACSRHGGDASHCRSLNSSRSGSTIVGGCGSESVQVQVAVAAAGAGSKGVTALAGSVQVQVVVEVAAAAAAGTSLLLKPAAAVCNPCSVLHDAGCKGLTVLWWWVQGQQL